MRLRRDKKRGKNLYLSVEGKKGGENSVPCAAGDCPVWKKKGRRGGGRPPSSSKGEGRAKERIRSLYLRRSRKGEEKRSPYPPKRRGEEIITLCQDQVPEGGGGKGGKLDFFTNRGKRGTVFTLS